MTALCQVVSTQRISPKGVTQATMKSAVTGPFIRTRATEFGLVKTIQSLRRVSRMDMVRDLLEDQFNVTVVWVTVRHQ